MTILRWIKLRPQVGKDRIDIGAAVAMIRNGMQIPKLIQPLNVRPVDGETRP